jgi:hypothetical protein
MDVSEEASKGTTMSLLPVPRGRVDREVEDELVGSRTAAIAVWWDRRRYVAKMPRPIP